MIPEFEEFPKIARFSGEGLIITEKIDGTNAQIYISEEGEIQAGSRNRYISPGKNTDNYGFAGWVEENKEALIEGLGPGRHFGEWWGAGIGRKYGIPTKRFSLFNVLRWSSVINPKPSGLPLVSGVSVVPVLYSGVYSLNAIEETLAMLKAGGSVAEPGFLDPEGIVMYLPKSKTYFNKYIKNDLIIKSLQVVEV